MNKEITVKASLDNLDKVLGFVEEYLESAGCPMKIAMKITVCVEEVFVNVASYAYDGEEGDCTIQLDSEDSGENGNIGITIVDSGKAFNPLEQKDPDITLSADERNIGGLGIFMVKNTMDRIIYDYKEEKNVFFMEKSW